MRLRTLLLSGIMVGLAVLLQTAPIWLGQPVGFALAILACLPMAISAAAGPGALPRPPGPSPAGGRHEAVARALHRIPAGGQGAKALIAQLQKAGAFGLISTHDLELGELERESGGRITNYHFREYYRGEEIHFDYKLRRASRRRGTPCI